ncbi:ATP-binding protein [Tistrella bauzanensis]|uniref:ATP-binding protein n=1 Tax=Tistrella TaxID=171436 RepID=UPI0031F69AB2
MASDSMKAAATALMRDLILGIAGIAAVAGGAGSMLGGMVTVVPAAVVIAAGLLLIILAGTRLARSCMLAMAAGDVAAAWVPASAVVAAMPGTRLPEASGREPSDDQPGVMPRLMMEDGPPALAEALPDGRLDLDIMPQDTNEIRFRRLFDLAPIGIALVDDRGGIIAGNAALARLAGEEALEPDQTLAELIVADRRFALAEALDGVFRGTERPGVPIEVSFRQRPDRVASLLLRRADEERMTAALVHVIDVTERKELEVQFAQSQKMQAVGQLAGGVAHDFNNLLTAMIGFCDLLLMRHPPGDASFADVMQIKQNANRAANLVRQLLAFSRQQTLQPRVLDITDVLAELTHLLRRLLGEAIVLDVHHGRDLAPVRVDQGQLEQVIINLAVNARDAMPSGGQLSVATRNFASEDTLAMDRDWMMAGGRERVPTGDYVMVELRDTGSGIPRDILPKIFEPFFTTKAAGQGTGLGLATAYGIVRQTGGFLFVRSEPGRGTAFRILLPRHTEVETTGLEIDLAPEAPVARRSDIGETGGRVLFVEDEAPVRAFAARALRQRGFTVEEAESADAAAARLDELVEAGIDVMVTDVVMPGMDGPTLAEKVRERLPGISIVFISGYAEDTFRRRLGDDPNVRFLPKPFNLKQLVQTVRDAMDEAVE